MRNIVIKRNYNYKTKDILKQLKPYMYYTHKVNIDLTNKDNIILSIKRYYNEKPIIFNIEYTEIMIEIIHALTEANKRIDLIY